MLQTKYITDTDKLTLENERLSSNDVIKELNKKIKLIEDQNNEFKENINKLTDNKNELNKLNEELSKKNKELTFTESVCKNQFKKFKNIDESIKEQSEMLKRPIYSDQKQSIMNELSNKIIQKQNLMGTLERDRDWEY